MSKSDIKTLILKYQVEMENMKNKLDYFNEIYNPKIKESPYTRNYTDMLITRDRILATNRYIWKLPYNITSQKLETFLYHFGNIVFFVKDGKLKIAQYAQKGELNMFGELDEITPIGFNGKSYPYKLNVQNYDENEKNKCAVICCDYTSFGNFCKSRYSINKETTVRDEVETYKQILCNVKNSIHKAIALCDDESQADFVRKEVAEILSSDSPIAAFAGSKDDLGKLVNLFNINNVYNPQDYTQLIDFYNKIRRRNMGVPSPDVFEKKERMVAGEIENIHADNEIILLDGYYNRKKCVENIKKYLDFDGIDEIDVEINPNIYPEKVGERNGELVKKEEKEEQSEVVENE